MGNALNEQINDGDELVINANHFAVVNKPLDKRIFVADGGGFGSSPATYGNAVYGAWKHDGVKDRVEGWMIDVDATRLYRKKE